LVLTVVLGYQKSFANRLSLDFEGIDRSSQKALERWKCCQQFGSASRHRLAPYRRVGGYCCCILDEHALVTRSREELASLERGPPQQQSSQYGELMILSIRAGKTEHTIATAEILL
jgi:hypothetical protein